MVVNAILNFVYVITFHYIVVVALTTPDTRNIIHSNVDHHGDNHKKEHLIDTANSIGFDMDRKDIKKVKPGNTNTSRSNNNTVAVPVLLWDETSSNAKSVDTIGSLPPRYLIGKLGIMPSLSLSSPTVGLNSIDKSDSGADDIYSGRRNHYFTFDLGNGHETMFVVEGCTGCSCDNGCDNSTVVGVSCCPDTMERDQCQEGGVNDSGGGDFCWPSRRSSFLPRTAYRDVEYPHCPKRGGAARNDTLVLTGILPAQNGGTGDSEGIERVVALSSTSASACSQCFGQRRHSRFYIPAESDNLVIIGANDDDGDHNEDGDDKTSSSYNDKDNHDEVLIRLGSKFRFGALIRTYPLVDRVWSNIGLGYGSSFLSQMGYTALLFHLRPGIEDDESRVVFNAPVPKRSRLGDVGDDEQLVQVCPYKFSKKGKRIHYVNNLIFEENENNSVVVGTKKKTKFHIDTGNDGISLKDEVMIKQLALVTGGNWTEEDDLDRQMRYLWDEPFEYREKHEDKPPPDPCFKPKRLFVPYGPVSAPNLHVELHPNATVTLHGPSWVINDEGETIFVTYGKNVLGLPFLCSKDADGASLDFLFDDLDQLLYIIRGDASKDDKEKELEQDDEWDDKQDSFIATVE